MSPLQQLDESIFRFIHVDMHQVWLDYVMRFITDTGRGEVKFLVLAGLCFVYRYRRYMLMVLVSGVTSGLFAQVIKQLNSRERPGNLEFADPLPSFIEALSGSERTNRLGVIEGEIDDQALIKVELGGRVAGCNRMVVFPHAVE